MSANDQEGSSSNTRLTGEQQYSQIYDIQQLFAMPLLATVDADFYAAQRFVQYLREYGFTNGSGDNWGKLRTITFIYHTTNPQGLQVEHRIELPALSLIPLPLLQVKQADFEMEVRILGSIESPQPGGIHTATGEADPIKVKAALTPLRQETINEMSPNLIANLRAKIAMRQADLPAGISSLLNISQSASNGSQVTILNRLQLTPSSLELTNAQKASVIVTLVDVVSAQPIPNKAIASRISAAADWLILQPAENVKTDDKGQATFTISQHSTSTSSSATGEIVFMEGNAQPVKLTISKS